LTWRIEFTPAAAKELRKPDRLVARRIGRYLQDLVASCGDPRQRGKGLTANQAGLWRYRVGDYRVICQLEEDRLLVLVVRIGHRSLTCRALPTRPPGRPGPLKSSSATPSE
jgi:mRNA interferase RelE/StbE